MVRKPRSVSSIAKLVRISTKDTSTFRYATQGSLSLILFTKKKYSENMDIL